LNGVPIIGMPFNQFHACVWHELFMLFMPHTQAWNHP